MGAGAKDMAVASPRHGGGGSGGGAAGGQAMPLRKFVATILAISFGTIIEWYDYSIYTQLSKVLSKVFFPSNDPALQALSFWGVYAVGFVSRPAGALLFGHLGDTKGRGTCLLVSVLVMGVPTVLIGCLPTYAQVGVAAPAAMAFLRLFQGLAMGGEFGAAMVYLYELASPRYKGVTGSVGYVSLGAGVVLGILVVNAVLSFVPAEADLLRWGWRVPFLAASVSLAAAVVLRYNMPETAEFAEGHEELGARAAARARQQRRRQHGRRQAQQPQQQQSADVDAAVTIVDDDDDDDDGAAAAAKDVEGGAGATAAVAPAKHYVPLWELLRGYWGGLLLHVGYAAWNACAFHLGYSWLPSFFVAHAGIPVRTSLWMLLSCMVLFTLVVPIAGYVSDRGVPRVSTNIAVAALSAAAYVPTFLGFKTHSLAVCWALQAVHLGLVAWAMGVLPAIVSRIYPAGVRISGFNLGHNFGATFGGLTPLIITAIQASTGAVYLGPALFMVAMAVGSVVASLLLIRFFPDTNRAP